LKKENLFIARLKERLAHRGSPELVLSLASEYKKMGKIYQAIAVLKEMIDKNPEYIPGRLALGRYYLECNMLYDAKKEFYEIINRDPDNPFVKVWLSKIEDGVGSKKFSNNRDEAINRLNRFLIILKRRFSKSEQTKAGN
jgi:tetratricopeptide (TPR) repeat protein